MSWRLGKRWLGGAFSLTISVGTLFSSCTAFVDVSDDGVTVRLPGVAVDVTDDSVTIDVPCVDVDVSDISVVVDVPCVPCVHVDARDTCGCRRRPRCGC
jgi:hypothetical protein